MTNEKEIPSIRRIKNFIIQNWWKIAVGVFSVYFIISKKDGVIKQSNKLDQSATAVMTMPSTREEAENWVASQTTKARQVCLLDHGDFAMIRGDMFRRNTAKPVIPGPPKPVRIEGRSNETPEPTTPAVSPEVMRKMLRQVQEEARKKKTKGSTPLVVFQACKKISRNYRPIDPSELEAPNTDPPIRGSSSLQTVASLSPADMRAVWEGSLPVKDVVLDFFGSPDGSESFYDKSISIFNSVESTAKRIEEWIDPVPLYTDVPTDQKHDYATQILDNLQRDDPQIFESASLEATGSIGEGPSGEGPSTQQISLTSDSRSE